MKDISETIVDVENQMDDMFIQICKSLEFIKSDIDTNPEDAKKFIDSIIFNIAMNRSRVATAIAKER